MYLIISLPNYLMSKPNSSASHLENLILTFKRKIADVCRKEGLLYELTFTQIELVRYIGPDGKVTMKSIAEFLKISPPSATSMVAELEKKGAVLRINDPNDRRIVLVSLTKKTREVYTKMQKHKETVFGDMLSRLTLADRKSLERIITILIND